MLDSLEVIRRVAQHDRQLERLETLPAGGGGGVGAHNASLVFIFDRGGAVITTSMLVRFRVHFAGTIIRWTVIATTSGSIRFNVSKATFAAYPTLTNIDGSAPPQLTSAQKAESTVLTGWTTAFSQDDIFNVNVDSAVTPSGIVRATVILEVIPS